MDISSNEYKNQYHYFYRFTDLELIYLEDGETVYLNPNIIFPVKKVKFNFAYYFNSDGLVNFVATSNIVNSDVIGVLNRYSLTNNAGDVISADSLKESNSISFVFKDVQQISGLSIKLIKLLNVTLTDADITIHIEFLG
jgi:hypothetical protein